MAAAKVKSGAQKRKEKAQREGQSGHLTGEVAKLLKELGPPPTEKAHGRLVWGNKVLALLAYATLTQKAVDLTRVRLVKDLLATMGITFPRTELEELADEGDKQKRPKVEGQTTQPAPGSWKKDKRGAQGQAPPEGGEAGDPPP